MAGQRRRKRARATPAELPESSSSRLSNLEPRIPDGDAPPIGPVLPDEAHRILPSEAAAEADPLSSVLTAVREDAPEETVQGSSMQRVMEAPGIATSAGHITALDELGNVDLPAEPDMQSNIPPHTQPSRAAGATLDNHAEASIEDGTPTNEWQQMDVTTGAEEDQAEALAERVSNEELGTEIPRSSQVGTSTAINERDDHCETKNVLENSMSIAKSPSIAGEEALEDRADGMNCPICMEPWTGEGIHRICCLACGHLFGRSCIRRWLNQRGKKNSKCPHCNRKAKIEDIRNLYIPTLTVIDDKSQQLREELGVMKLKNEELVLQNDKLRKEHERLQVLLLSVCHPRDIPRSKENFFMRRPVKAPQEYSRKESYGKGNQAESGNYFQARESLEKFELQEEFSLPGARVFDMDAHSQMLLVAQKSTTIGGAFNLNKISLLSLSDTLVMPLPQCTGAVRDICIAPPGAKLPGRLSLVASLGKMLSLFSLESNNVVLTYKLQSPCWSCAWDPDEPNYVFAGLQDGVVTIFDLRHTSLPLRSLQSFSRQPVHTLHPSIEFNLPQSIKRNGVLSACSSGVCFWESSTPGLYDCRPHAVACPDSPGICVALAYNHLVNEAVATFREKPTIQQSGSIHHATQAVCTEPSIIMSSQPNSHLNLGFHPVRASHYPLIKSTDTSLRANHEISDSALEDVNALRMNCGWKYGKPMFGNVSPVGMHRSAIVCNSLGESSSGFQSLFAFGDEETHALMLWDVKSLTVVDRLKPHHSPILDVKSMNIGGQAILACTSTTNLQVYKR